MHQSWYEYGRRRLHPRPSSLLPLPLPVPLRKILFHHVHVCVRLEGWDQICEFHVSAAAHCRIPQIIVGASISGLTSAVALRSSGHTVLVLERDSEIGGSDLVNGGVRVAPNGFKTLAEWGLEAEIRENGVIGEGFVTYKYDHKGKESGRDYIGLSLWDPELLVDARGDFLQMRHKDLLEILYRKATEPTQNESSPGSATVLFNSEVAHIDCERCTVTLKSGETHSADAILGADGPSGLVRKLLLEEEPATSEEPQSELAVYMTVIPRSVALEHPVLKELYQYPQSNMIVTYLGNNRASKVFLVGKNRDVFVSIYTPDGDLKDRCGSWSVQSERNMREILGPGYDIMLHHLAEQASGPSACVQIKRHSELASWVSHSGKVVAIGNAAHPFPPMALHSCSTAIEDGAFIGKVFSHTKDPARIPEFFHAFEETRKPRCAYILSTEQNHIEFTCMPDGDKQIARDETLRANEAAGRNVLDAPDVDMHRIWEDMSIVFSYDPFDSAEEWWVSWGRLRDQAARVHK
ncbi:hypothetical protein FB45DRAFT_1064549 [Roridomyces roridus]|uniref:FAD-binding domain-containing protein n=1 Tax=Roridomyces roridus TaxID=1738132 RepID=A0AAD7BAQ9_9AGAR|nr:hypothetical protein FB45DRAFT_1064549 [Roridomyces roridus]